MKPEKRETSFERTIRLSLWAALAVLYMTLVVVTFIKLSLMPQQAGVQAIDAAWLGFWGNVVGGVLGLAGGLIAAYAAVRAVERQLQHAEQERKSASRAQLSAYVGILKRSLEETMAQALRLVDAFAINDLRLSTSRSSSLFSSERWIDKHMRKAWRSAAPGVATQLTMFRGWLDQHEKEIKRARKLIRSGEPIDPTKEMHAAASFYRVGATSGLLLMNGATLCREIARELQDEEEYFISKAKELEGLVLILKPLVIKAYDNLIELGGRPDGTPL